MQYDTNLLSLSLTLLLHCIALHAFWFVHAIAYAAWALGLLLDVKEVQCGDPNCAPIDTVFTLVWSEGGRGVFALPFSTDELGQEDIQDLFPDEETLALWQSGKKAPWPKRPSLRFTIGDRVECRVGPHPVKGWAQGRVIKLHYSEPSWPPNMVAPYQVALHDGRLIFAPQDVDQVIRLRPPAAPDAPSSPEYVIPSDDDDDAMEDEEEEYDDEEGEGDYADYEDEEQDGEAGN